MPEFFLIFALYVARLPIVEGAFCNLVDVPISDGTVITIRDEGHVKQWAVIRGLLISF